MSFIQDIKITTKNQYVVTPLPVNNCNGHEYIDCHLYSSYICIHWWMWASSWPCFFFSWPSPTLLLRLLPATFLRWSVYILAGRLSIPSLFQRPSVLVQILLLLNKSVPSAINQPPYHPTATIPYYFTSYDSFSFSSPMYDFIMN